MYGNFWFRNAMVVLLIYALAFSAGYFEGKDYRHFTAPFAKPYLVLYLPLLFSNLILVRKLLLKRNYWMFALSFLAFWIAIFIRRRFPVDMPYGLENISWFTQLARSIPFIGLGTGAYFIHLWIMDNVVRTGLRLARTETELNFLKRQLNPHFLLNALNNLYGESLTSPEETPERILQLSELLRYQIEATKMNAIRLHNEIDFVQKYMDYYVYKTEHLHVSNTTEKLTCGEREVPPLLFMAFVENALKFSIETPEPKVEMRWYEDEGAICFKIRNNFKAQNSKHKGTGVGLANVRNRLDLLSLKYRLHTEVEGNMFSLNFILC